MSHVPSEAQNFTLAQTELALNEPALTEPATLPSFSQATLQNDTTIFRTQETRPTCF